MGKRYDVVVDHIARLAVWEMDGCHFAIMLRELPIEDELRARIEAWIQSKRDLCLQRRPADVLPREWTAYDSEGRDIAQRLRSALEVDAEVYYFFETEKRYERVL